MRPKREVEASVLDLARERIRDAFDLFDTIAVSFSGGKDSTIVLNLTLEAARERGRLPLPVFFYDEEAIPYQTEEYVRRVAAEPDIDLRWLCLPVQHRNACSRKEPYWWPWAPEAKERWVRPMPPEAITELDRFPMEQSRRPTLPDSAGLLFDPLRFGRVSMMLGIRADESLTRTRAILARTADHPHIRHWTEGLSKGNLWKVYPIYDWRTADVWTAPAEFGWDYNRAYDVMEMAGLPHKDQRCAPPYGEEPMLGLSRYAVCFPEIWDAMTRRVHGAATAARYSRTELYAFGKRPEKPAGMPWEEFVRFWIGKHNPKERPGVARRVADWIRQHYGKTTDPLAVKAPHPVSGISWDFLVKIAVRGDYKGRKQPQVWPEGSEGREKAKARYAAEIAAMRERGEL